MLARPMATMLRIISWMACSLAWAPGITGDIRRISGIADGTMIAGMDAADGTGTEAGRVAGDTGIAMRAMLAKIRAAVTRVVMVDSVVDRLSAEVSPTAVAASMVEADSTAADIANCKFC